MSLFGKLKEILFDEETVEIPVITKEEKSGLKEEKKAAAVQNKEIKSAPTRATRVQNNSNADEVIIKKIETPKRVEKEPEQDYITYNDDDLFDEMPKLKTSEVIEPVESVKKPKTFTFPVYEDDETKEVNEEPRTRSQVQKEIDIDEIKQRPEPPKREEVKPVQPKQQKPSGYTNAFDYSYGKYKGDYKTSRESNSAVLKTTLERKDERKAFSPSPVISPVYGVLNENYKKEDIVSKGDRGTEAPRARVLDLDSVRRKAYGTLEDEIEVTLTRSSIEEESVEEYVGEPEILDDEGLSINDLLVDNDEREDDYQIEEVDGKEFFDSIEDETVSDEIELDEEEIPIPERQKTIPIEREDEEPEEQEIIEDESEKRLKSYSDEVLEEAKKEKTSDIKEAIGEEDLFDLIDSIYQGKGEE